MTITMLSGRRAVKAEMLTLLLLMALMLVLTTACNNKDAEADTPPVAMSAVEIAEAAIAAQAGLNSFVFNGDMNVTIGGETPGWASASIEGAVDQAQTKMWMSIGASITMNEPEPVQAGLEMFLVDDVAYLKIEPPEMPGITGAWVKVPAPATEEPWSHQDIYTQMTDLLIDAVEVESLSTELVGEIECHKLQVTPSVSKLLAWAKEQPGMGEQVPDTRLEDAVLDLTMVVWVAADTFIPLKGSLDGTVALEGNTLEVHITSQMHDINEPVTIELPPEATAALEMPLPINVFGADRG